MGIYRQLLEYDNTSLTAKKVNKENKIEGKSKPYHKNQANERNLVYIFKIDKIT